MKLGIIQSRGLGDIVIALPIADYYYKQGWEIHWPICEEFIPNFRAEFPWVNWHPVKTDAGSFFLEQPRKILESLGCDEIMPLYQALTGESFHTECYFQHTKFDQYKYIRAGVPLQNKWQLNTMITRRPEREQAIVDLILERISPKTEYTLIHLQGSDHRAEFDHSILNPDWPAVEITELTDSCWDWCRALDRAECVILSDSVFSNIVDQMALNTDDGRYFIPRSHIGLTPVLGQHWNWIPNLALDPRHKTITVK